MKERDVLKAMLEKNGARWQTTVAIEELAELTKALTKQLRGQGARKQIIEEIADVELCLAQLKRLHVRDARELALFKRFKLERLALFYATGEQR